MKAMKYKKGLQIITVRNLTKLSSLTKKDSNLYLNIPL
jgi:hypothetical protein